MKFWTVDCFAEKVFQGNPAGVCVVDQSFSDELMQKIATEINLPETAFLISQESNHFGFRCFSPTSELKSYGHSLLAAAHILWSTNHPQAGENLYFETSTGIMKAQKTGQGISLDLPAFSSELTAVPDWLLTGLNVTPVSVAKSGDDLVVELQTADQVTTLEPNLAKFAKMDFEGVILTADYDETNPYDFVSRYFILNQNPFENSAHAMIHCKLGPYWSERLGKDQLKAYQASKRGATFDITCNKERVFVEGHATTVFKGQFLTSPSDE
jgi:PhzF family phenazine biosynthesis protein